MTGGVGPWRGRPQHLGRGGWISEGEGVMSGCFEATAAV